MTRRTLMWAGVVALFLLGVGGVCALYGTHTVTFTEAEVQERINRQLGKEFPVQGTARILIRTVKAEGATVHLEGTTVTTLIDIEGTLRTNKKFALTAFAVGVPVFEKGAFFFRPQTVEVQKFAYEGSTPTEVFSRLATRYVSNDKARQLIEDKAPKVEAWMTTTAENAAMHALERRPVYRPKDDVKGVLIKASLKKIEVVDNALVITFSLWQLTLSVLFGLLCLLGALALAWAMMQSPILGLGIMLIE